MQNGPQLKRRMPVCSESCIAIGQLDWEKIDLIRDLTHSAARLRYGSVKNGLRQLNNRGWRIG